MFWDLDWEDCFIQLPLSRSGAGRAVLDTDEREIRTSAAGDFGNLVRWECLQIQVGLKWHRLGCGYGEGNYQIRFLTTSRLSTFLHHDGCPL
jgi:hypothetical protein